MTGLDKPLDIIDQHWPPEAEQKQGPDCKDTFVPEVLVSLLDESETPVFRYYQLVATVWFSVP